jgi:hypothetical protein
LDKTSPKLQQIAQAHRLGKIVGRPISRPGWHSGTAVHDGPLGVTAPLSDRIRGQEAEPHVERETPHATAARDQVRASAKEDGKKRSAHEDQQISLEEDVTPPA